MPPLTESTAERLATEQATALVRVLDLQALWEAHRDDPAKSASSTPDLRERQRAHDAFQAALRDYTSRYGNTVLPEPTQVMPKRLAIWCRVLRGLFRRAEGECPVQVMAKVHRVADRIAERTGEQPPECGQAEDMAGAVREMDAVVAWCERLVAASQLAIFRPGENG
ncbi:MAG TPA: hypothetical protein VKE74_28740 [Gemmataceae bacterium]|nr:hypothetical protein [Gemmataceae bacterium]